MKLFFFIYFILFILFYLFIYLFFGDPTLLSVAASSLTIVNFF